MAGDNVDISDIPLMVHTTKSLIRGMQTIDELTQTLDRNLHDLGVSFKDEGYMTIQTLINENAKLIEKNKPEFDKVTRAMTKYIELLIKAKDATKNP